MGRVRRIFLRKYLPRLFTALFWWGITTAALLFYPAPGSLETLRLHHFLFFLPLFLAFLFSAHIFTGHIRRSILVALMLVGLAILQLLRLVTPINIVLLFISGAATEYWFHHKK